MSTAPSLAKFTIGASGNILVIVWHLILRPGSTLLLSASMFCDLSGVLNSFKATINHFAINRYHQHLGSKTVSKISNHVDLNVGEKQ